MVTRLLLLVFVVTFSAYVATGSKMVGISLHGGSIKVDGGQTLSGCTDGVDCLCDRISNPSDPIYDPNVIFCEDWEKGTSYFNYEKTCSEGNSEVSVARSSGWFVDYGNGGTDNSCICAGPNGVIGGGDDFFSNNFTDPVSCVAVVDEPNCGVGGLQNEDCVFNGNYSLASKFEPTSQKGKHGVVNWTQTTQLGVTMAIRYSSNFVNPTTPVKTDEFTPGDVCWWGCNTDNTSDATTVSPDPLPALSQVLHKHWSMGLNIGSCDGGSCFGTLLKGAQYETATAAGELFLAPLASDYTSSDDPLGKWACWQLHITNIGTANSTVRRWYNGNLVIHVQNVNTSTLRSGANSGIDGFVFNHYFNGGYIGSDRAYRYEDEIVVTTGPEPVPCSAIGF